MKQNLDCMGCLAQVMQLACVGFLGTNMRRGEGRGERGEGRGERGEGRHILGSYSWSSSSVNPDVLIEMDVSFLLE